MIPTMAYMVLEVTRLLFGLVLLTFHRQVADYILKQERMLVTVLRQRGLAYPPAPSTETTRNIYFLISTFVVLFEIARIWMLLRGQTI